MSLAASAGRGPAALWSPTHVQVTVLQARGLRAKGPGGTSDAYAVIQVGKEKYATSVSERSLGAPVWREEATFELPPLLSSEAVPAAAATLQLTVLHRALLGLDKFLGRAEVDLRELHRDQGRRKKQWYTLKSKPGKKEKERGEIEVDIQFMRNNMTASMFDLSMKDKSRNPFGKLKDKIKGKNKDSMSDTASAIVPSVTPSVDSDDDESFSKDKKKKSKIKTLFSKSNLQKTPLSQSMSVLPTLKPGKVLLRPGDFQSQWEDDGEDEASSSASDVTSHKRTASADLKQLSQISFSLPRKEGLSFLGGLRSKSDVLSRSNVCINGNHVYMEQPEAKGEHRDSSPSSSSPSPQAFRKKRLFSSTENLATQACKEPEEGGGLSPDRQLTGTSTKDSLKSLSLPSYRPVTSGDIRESVAPANLETVKETKDSKKQESKKSSLLSLVTGKKEVAKGSGSENPPPALGRDREGVLSEDQPGQEELAGRSEEDAAVSTSSQGHSLNPFEDPQISGPEAGPEAKSEPKTPVPSARAPQTRAVKPRLEVSPEAQPTARLPSSPDSSPRLPALLPSFGRAPAPSELGKGSESQSSEHPIFSFSAPSPVAPPLSTSTPIGHWPLTGQGQASPEDPALLLRADLQKESVTLVPNAGSSALGSLFKQPPTSVWKGPESPPGGKTGEMGIHRKESETSVLEQPGQQEELPTHLSEEAPKGPLVLPLGSGRMASPAGKPPLRGHTDLESQSASSVESKVEDSGMSSTVKETTPPLQVEEPPCTSDAMIQNHQEMGLNDSMGGKTVKKRVSFSEQLFVEEEVKRSAELEEEDENHPQELAHIEAVTGNGSDAVSPRCPHAEDTERETVSEPRPWTCSVSSPTEDGLGVVSPEKSPSEDPTNTVSSVSHTPLLRTEGDDTFLAEFQSQASDHEGTLSDPLSGRRSVSDVKSPIMADLNLTLPSIPEVASDDEKIDQVEDEGKTAKPAVLEVGASSSSTLPPCPEQTQGLTGGTDGMVSVESLCDIKSQSPTAEPKVALGINKPHLGEIPREEKQLPCPGVDEEEKPSEAGRPSEPLSLSPSSPVSSPSLSETFSAVHSFPCSPHADTHYTRTAESPKKAATEGSTGRVENFGKRKPLLQAWVSPSETHAVSAQPGAGTGAAKHRLHPVKPMNTTATKIANSSLGTATIISENTINEAMIKKYSPSDPAFAYAQLTHDELIQLVLKQKETISKKEFQVRELEDYIDNLLVRVMEETPNILRIPPQLGKRAGKM